MTAPACVLVTTFAEGQPGFLDFSYRIRALAQRYRLTVLSMQPLEQAELLVPDVEYRVIACRAGRAGWLQYLWRCAMLIRRRRPAVAVLLHSMAAPLALLLGKTPTATYWNEHPSHVAPAGSGVNPLKALARALVRALMFGGARHASVVMPIGEAHRDDLLAHGCRPARVRLLYMGVDASFSAAAPAAPAPPAPIGPDRPLQLIYVGSVHAQRGRDVMLAAMALVRQAALPAHLTILGASDEQLAYCRGEVARLGIAAQVSVLGRVPGMQVPAYFRRADAGLCLWEDLPWYRFNPPTKLFEYLVAGLPVLASNIRTHTEYVRDGDNGLIFDYHAEGLAGAIARLCGGEPGLARLRRGALDSSTRYLWPDIEAAFLKSIEEVIR